MLSCNVPKYREMACLEEGKERLTTCPPHFSIRNKPVSSDAVLINEDCIVIHSAFTDSIVLNGFLSSSFSFLSRVVD